ncbi:flavin reductase family protein [Amycolatopsis rhabdoformis]|uniref:Flavin reductase family protein n=1 Tax=Amycolatopsis rhabdoformis TaxID=1448059 RepID=A0ABZ1IBY7_9PSEU|nr:flavin reductase family protein [Amycolatopsis rhabdoformis]WSE31996.1 flavin reductase family protein [Amycolatopsis rhabdoformis]
MTSSTSPSPGSALGSTRSMSAPVQLAGYGVDADRFRGLAASLPTSVSVITTTAEDGSPIGMTSGTVCSLSCEPPLLLVCLGKASRTLRAIRDRGRFGVNVLDRDGSETSAHFASRVADKFATTGWRRGRHGSPVLEDNVVAFLECELYQVVDGGDHAIVVGLVMDGDHTDAAPLVYFRRTYSGFGD